MTVRLATESRGLILLLAPITLAVCGCNGLANMVILYPSRQPIATRCKRIEVPRVAADDLAGHELEAYYLEVGAKTPSTGKKSTPDFYVYALTGNAGRAERMPEFTATTLAPWLEAHPDTRVGIFAMQSPGFGRDPGSATLDAHTRVAWVGYRYLRQQLARDRPIIIHGLSLGTTAALHVARLAEAEGRPAQGLLIEKPPRLRALVMSHGWWNLWLIAGAVALGVPMNSLSVVNAEHIERTPAVFIAALRDEIVPKSNVDEIANAFRGPKRLIPADCGHNDVVTPTCCPELRAALKGLLPSTD